MLIRPLHRPDFASWLAMRQTLWPDSSRAEASREWSKLTKPRCRIAIFVAEAEGALVGFLEANLREYADGCATSPVGYIEGWFVKRGWRRKGAGRALVAAAETWARSKGCSEMGSDAHATNALSRRAHKALGYREIGQLIAFAKSLKPR